MDEQKLNEFKSLLVKMNALQIVNDFTLLQGRQFLEMATNYFRDIKNNFKTIILSQKKELDNKENYFSNLSKEYNSSRMLVNKRINVYADFLRSTAEKHFTEITDTVLSSEKIIQEEYAEQLEAEKIQAEIKRKEARKHAVLGYVVDDMVILAQAVASGEISQGIFLINDSFMREIARRYKYRFCPPGMRWIYKDRITGKEIQ